MLEDRAVGAVVRRSAEEVDRRVDERELIVVFNGCETCME